MSADGLEPHVPSAAIAACPWLAACPVIEGFHHLSEPRAYQHDETSYDQQYASGANLHPGRGLVELLRREPVDLAGPALEIGCGTGLLSLGLVDRSPYPLTILSDPSPAFLRLTRSKLRQAGVSDTRAAFAVLRAEDVDRLPRESCSLIALRSTLHHVVDVEAFIAGAARALRPGGVLTFEEPCQDGFILMGAMIQFLPELSRARGLMFSDEQLARIRLFSDAMAFYARRDVDKSTAEDKHLFRVDEVMTIGARAGLDVRFTANRGYEDFDPDGRRRTFSFSAFFREYAMNCMSWSPELMNAFDECIAPYTSFVERSSGGGSGPYFHGVFMCHKRAARS